MKKRGKRTAKDGKGRQRMRRETMTHPGLDYESVLLTPFKRIVYARVPQLDPLPPLDSNVHHPSRAPRRPVPRVDSHLREAGPNQTESS